MEFSFDRVVKDLIVERERWRRLPGYNCFWSGPDNNYGLRLTPTVESGRVWVSMLIKDVHTGIPGIAHGGIPFSILDGLMGWLVMSHLGRVGFTTKATVAYFAPLHADREYLFEATPVAHGSVDPSNVLVQGRVFETKNRGKMLIQMNCEFFLPDKPLAEKILGPDVVASIPEMFGKI